MDSTAPTPVDALRDKQLYLCCNLFIEPSSRWISDLNWRQPLMVPAGTPVKATAGGRKTRTVITWDAASATIEHRYGTREESTEDFLRKLLLERDPRPIIEQFPPLVRHAIAAAKVTPGMTRTQVLMAIGHPPTNATASPTMREWVYFIGPGQRVEVVFGADGGVSEVAGLTTARASVLFTPQSGMRQ